MYLTHITHYFEATLAAYPDRIAVYDGERSVTFQQLYERVLYEADRISQKLAGKTGQVIGVFLPKSLEAVVADLAILYSGNAYMNLDVKYPEQRMCAILEQVCPALLIAGGESCPSAGKIPVLSLEDAPQTFLGSGEREAVLALRERCIDTDLLCLINTSGSTGIPKAVALNHRSFIDFTEAVTAAGLMGDDEVVASLSPAVFDIFSFELCMLMAKGSTLVLVPETFAAFPVRLLELMVQRQVTFLFWVPTIMVNIANTGLLDQIALPDLRMV